VRKLTLQPQKMVEADVVACRDAGCSDAEIFEANQVCAYFNYSNRLLNGLGVTTKGDLLGYSPPNTEQARRLGAPVGRAASELAEATWIPGATIRGRSGRRAAPR
jgi:hypothetical protein